MPLKIGFVGLGTMGAPMAQNLLNHGHAIAVWARRSEAMAPLIAAGAAAATAPRTSLPASDVVMTMVTDTRAVEDVVLGERGIVRGARLQGLS